LTILVAAVGGQMLRLVVLKLARRLAPLARRLRVEEVFGMAQKGGAVAAVIEVDLHEARPLPSKTVLLGLECIEGARHLQGLRSGAVAFISSGVLLPPGLASAGPRAPSSEDLERSAARLGVDLVIVDTPAASVWPVVQAALDAGVIP
jgi:indolepyruvate ferredoxin oxidoreductase beta subunit